MSASGTYNSKPIGSSAGPWFFLFLFCSSSWACQSTGVTFHSPPETKSTLGEMVYAIAFRNAEQTLACSIPYQDLLSENETEVVNNVDTIFTEEILADLPVLMSNSVLPNVDSGTLELLFDSIATTASLLIDDSYDPQRKTLHAIVDSLQNNQILQDQHGIEFARSIFADPGFPLGLHAFASLSEVPNTHGSALDSLLEGASHFLQADPYTGQCQGLSEQDYVTALLQTEEFEQAPVAGVAAWVARVDASGNPLVAIDPTTQTVYLPFVDQNNDGLADLNADNLPIDANGAIVEIAPFGFGDSYDDSRRRVAADSTPLFVYYDAKKTALAHGLRIAGEAFSKGLLPHGAALLDAAMGPQELCQDQQNCSQYSSINNPIYQALFTLIEIAQYEKPIVFFQTWSRLLHENPELSEDILVSVGSILNDLGNSDLDGSDPSLYAVIDQFLPLLATTFRIQTRQGRPMPRLLMDLILDLGQEARDFPQELLISLQHTSLIKENECSSEAPDPNSPTVDYTRPRFFVQNGTTTIDNRSTLEKSLALLLAADCGSVPFTGGKTVAHTIIDLMSRLTPDTVCDLIDNLLGILGFTGSVGEAVVNSSLFLLGCNDSGDVRASQLFELDDLARSGALDFYLPIAKTFRQENELAALVSMLAIAAEDLAKDEDQSASTQSALRPFLPLLIQILGSGAVDPFFDLNELLVTIPAVDGDGTMADVLIDSGARLLDDTTTVATIRGPEQGVSLASELIDAIALSVERINAAGQSDSLSVFTNFATSYLTQTEVVDGKTRLKDRSLVPLLANAADSLLQASTLPRTQFLCYLNEWQTQSLSWIQSPVVANVLQAGTSLRNSTQEDQLNLFLARLLDPTPPNSSLSTATQYSELLRMAAELLQSPNEVAGADPLLNFAGAVLSPDREGAHLISRSDALLATDTEQTLWRLLANAAGPLGSPQADAPLIGLLQLADDYTSIDSGNSCQLTPNEPLQVQELEVAVSEFVLFLEEESSFVSQLIKLLKQRSSP